MGQILVDSPTLLQASLETVSDGWRLLVYQSTLIRPDDRLYRPVAAVIESYCSSEIFREELDDPGVWERRAVDRVIALWPVCPDTPHDCVVTVPKAREEVAGCRIIAQSANTTNTSSVHTRTTSAA